MFMVAFPNHNKNGFSILQNLFNAIGLFFLMFSVVIERDQ